MSDGTLWLALAVGIALGALGALVWRARRERNLSIETEVLRARLRSEETVRAERDQALARAREQLQGVFGELARDSLQSNSEVFLQLARERLARQQLDAEQSLKERETAIETLVQPIRDALVQGRGADSSHRARSHRLVRDPQDADGGAGRAARTCCRARPAIWSPHCAGPTCAANGARSPCAGWSNCPA